MTISKRVVAQTVHINLDATGVVTHSWQDTVYSLIEDGVEISRQTVAGENVEPDKLAGVLPEQAGLLRQITDLKTSASDALSSAKVKACETEAELQAKLDAVSAMAAETQVRLQAVTDQLTAAQQKIEAVQRITATAER